MKTKIQHLILASLFGTSMASQAGTFTWDGGGADGNWSTADNWVGNSAPVEADGWHTFVFDTSNQLNSNLDIAPGNNGFNTNDLTFNAGAGAFALSGSSIDMLGAASAGAPDGIADVTNNSANTQTINNNLIHHTGFNTGLVFNNTNGGAIVVDGVISQLNNEADDVTIQGNGTVTFNGVNTYTQDTILSSGTLVVGDSSALGTGTLTLNSGTLRTDTAAAGIALSNAIDASGTTNVFAGSVGLNLSGDITGSGTLVIGGSGSGQGSSGVSITDNLDGFTGKIRFDSVANLNSFSFGDGNTVNTTAALEVNGTNNKSNIRLWEHATFGELSGNGGNFTGDNSTLTINQDTDTTFGGQLLDVNSARELGFTKGGSGRLTLSGQNSYEWDTIVNGGTLEVSGRIGETERITVAGGAAFEVTGSGSLGSGGVYSGGGSGPGNIVNNGTFTYNSTTDQTLTGLISGTGALVKDNSGTLTIHVDSSYDGLTTVNGGTLVIDNSTGSARNFGAGDIEINNGATLQTTSTGGGQTRLQSRTITFGTSGGNTIDIGGVNTRVGGTTFVTTGGSTNFITGAALDLSTSAIYNVSDGTDDVDLQVSSVIQRSGITKDGNGTLSLTNTNNLQSNAININAGTLEIAGAGKLINGGNDYSGNINNDGIFKYNSTASQSFASIISGTGALEKDNSSTLTLTGANTYQGTTTVSNGTLSLATGYTHTGGGAYTVEGGTLKIADGVSVGSAMTISLGGVISPGNSPGTASTGAQTWNDGGSYLWEINASNDAGGTIGTDPGWDWLDITGTLDLSLLSTGGFTIDIDSLTSGNIAGDAVGFDTWTKGNPGDVDYSFIIASASAGISGFDATDFSFDSSGFSNGPSWDWQIKLSGTDLVLEAYAVPEPSSTALLGLGGLALMLRRKRS